MRKGDAEYESRMKNVESIRQELIGYGYKVFSIISPNRHKPNNYKYPMCYNAIEASYEKPAEMHKVSASPKRGGGYEEVGIWLGHGLLGKNKNRRWFSLEEIREDQKGEE